MIEAVNWPFPETRETDHREERNPFTTHDRVEIVSSCARAFRHQGGSFQATGHSILHCFFNGLEVELLDGFDRH